MKNKLGFLSFILFIIVVLTTGFNHLKQTSNLNGAWKWQSPDGEQIVLFIDGYVTHTIYSKSNKKFIRTRGGRYQQNNDKVTINIEFDTQDQASINKSESYDATISGKQLNMNLNGSKTWDRVDEGTAPLAGVWRITGRMQDGKIVPIHQTGSRKTLKILTGTRFQWAAINPETKEFFGTGGGTYTFENGKYAEQIEFFSRDSSRVGASLQFDGQLKDGNWHHSGLSSRGEKIYEIWSRTR